MAYINEELMTVYEADEVGLGGVWDKIETLIGGAKDMFAEYYKEAGRVETKAQMEAKLAQAKSAGMTDAQVAQLQKTMIAAIAAKGGPKKTFLEKYAMPAGLAVALIALLVVIRQPKK